MKRLHLLVLALLLPWGAVNAAESTTPKEGSEELVFERHVRPILKAHCFHCHGELGETQGGLDLRLRRFLAAGGDSGPAIVPGKPEESYLVARLRSQEMPPGDAKMPAEELAIIERWVATGAKTARPEPEKVTGPLITEEERDFWAFQPIKRPEVPRVKNQHQVVNPIDAFLLAKLEAKGFAFSPQAEKRALIRRATFDLWGLPPTPEEVEAFVADNSPDAYEKLIDRLLASPRYGERWGRHWLDVAGYADSEGYVENDPVRKWVYKYRDYVIQSFNNDKPWDEFICEQLAGDELVKPPYDRELTADEVEKLTATGFLRLAPDGTGSDGVDQVEARNEVIVNTLQIVSTSLMGMTVACAQCHDHRYDPIPQTDYYHLRAIFEPAFNPPKWRKPDARLVFLVNEEDRRKSAEIEAEVKKIQEAKTKREEEIVRELKERELAKLPEEIRPAAREAFETPASKRTEEQKKLLKKYPSLAINASRISLFDKKLADEVAVFTKQIAELRANKPKEEFVRALTEIPGDVPKTFLHYRGDPTQPREALEPADLTVLYPNESQRWIAPKNPDLKTSGRRLAFARKLTSGAHPLTARVLVNRFWLHHFGRGIVNTPGDFGMLGERPSHPELLDWLASEFMDSGWKLKQFHKLLMTSYAYRQQVRLDARQAEADPDNILYGGARLRRLEAEAVRDAVLAVSGKLNPKPFGEPVPVMADPAGQWIVGIENLDAGRPLAVIPLNGEEFRRSVFIQARRTRPLAVLDTFDLPRMEPNCEARESSTVAPQSLMLMNNEFILEQAEHFARRVHGEVGDDVQEQIRRAWHLALGRAPQPGELSDAAEFLKQQTADFEANASIRKRNPTADKNVYQPGLLEPKLQALAGLCQLLVSSNEFLYVE